MWPFTKKQTYPSILDTLRIILDGFDLPGLHVVKDGISFELTEEEQQKIEVFFKSFKDIKVHPEAYETFQKTLTAQALSQYAHDQMLIAEFEPVKKECEALITKAIASVTKAYSIHPLPIYIYDLACFMEALDKVDEAKILFNIFLKKQAEYSPTQIDKALLDSYRGDINPAIKHAEEKVK